MSKKHYIFSTFFAPMLVITFAIIAKPSFAGVISGADLEAKFQEYIPVSGGPNESEYEIIGEGRQRNGRGCVVKRKIDHLSICFVIFSAVDEYLAGNCYSHNPDPIYRVEFLEEPGTSLSVFERSNEFSSIHVNLSNQGTDVTINHGYSADNVKSYTCSLP